MASTDATVLLTGESGTGKELVARAIHAGSRRSEHPFVPVNCAAITETLLESELFGHARGSFTGAIRARRGLFEEASGGHPLHRRDQRDHARASRPSSCARSRRGRSGAWANRVSVKVDVRIIAATNQDLRRAIAEKRFREDLFYRLNVVPLRIPALRERREDIPLLARHFLDRHNRRNGGAKRWTVDALAHLLEHDWPGNVRELQNVVEQAAALSEGPEIGLADVGFGPEASRRGGAPAPRWPTRWPRRSGAPSRRRSCAAPETREGWRVSSPSPPPRCGGR